MSSDRSVRSSQLISPYGPGAIIDIGDESILLTDLRDWPKDLNVIEIPRLTNELGVTMLKSPPTPPTFGKVNARHAVKTIRFPRWMFCPNCRKMDEWRSDKGRTENGKPICSSPKCKKRYLVPMRFVAACESGHLSDVPWDFWAHSGVARKKCSSRQSRLYFRADSSKGSGLDALFVECDECGSKRHLGDITSPDALGALSLTCKGAQPWESWEQCSSPLVVLQRGASNLYYPIVRSALDIPREIGGRGSGVIREHVMGHSFFAAVQQLYEEDRFDKAASLVETIAKDFDTTPEKIAQVIKGGEQEVGERKIPRSEELQLAEWTLLTSSMVAENNCKNFVARVEANVKGVKTWGLDSTFKRIVLLDKLREVRAFCGFERVKPGVAVIPPAGRHDDIRWLPAIEVFGEGIFIEFDQSELVKWERKSSGFIKSRTNQMRKKYDEGKVSYLPEPTPRLVVLHTFAHLLIRQLSFECGYSSGSIRERIYAEDDQAGILIYTADSDSEGSLGGLVQQGEAQRIYSIIAAALEQASWCSNDPVCSEMDTQGIMGLNKAACHSCTLVSETSCTMNNLMLDRKLLLGSEGKDGFFSSILKSIKSDL